MRRRLSTIALGTAFLVMFAGAVLGFDLVVWATIALIPLGAWKLRT